MEDLSLKQVLSCSKRLYTASVGLVSVLPMQDGFLETLTDRERYCSVGGLFGKVYVSLFQYFFH